ncbi:hypothetical protein INR49_028621 [Caranx melampygus]|nr:hypothetical protein INR49_028621 [Caranx melampygus]
MLLLRVQQKSPPNFGPIKKALWISLCRIGSPNGCNATRRPSPTDSVPRPLVDDTSANTLRACPSACQPTSVALPVDQQGANTRKPSRWPHYHETTHLVGKNTAQSHILSWTKEYCRLVRYVVFGEECLITEHLRSPKCCSSSSSSTSTSTSSSSSSSSSSPCSTQQTQL